MLNVNNSNFRKARSAVTTAALLVYAATASSAEMEVSFPLVEEYLPSGDTSGYIKTATAFLDRNPSSKFAPRVALDLLMVADNTSNPKMADAMKACLLFEHPQSPQASFAVALFKEAEDFRQFVIRQADARLDKTPGALPSQFTQIVALGVGRFKDELLEDTPFLVWVHCFAKASGAAQLVERAEAKLLKKCLKDAELDRLIRLHFDKEVYPVQKIVALHGIEGEAAAFLERFYISRLSSSEEKRPEIVRILVENAVAAKEYEKALELIEPAAGEFSKDPQMLFWKAWALFALGKDETARETLGRIVNGHPGTKWAKTSGIYADGILHYSEYQKANAEELLAVSERLRKGIGVFEAKIVYVGKASKSALAATYEAYLGMVPDESRFEFCLHKENIPFLAYRTAPSGSAIYIENEPNVITFANPGIVPVPNMSLTRDVADEGRFNFQAGFVMGTSMKEAGMMSAAFLDSPYLSTPEGLMTFLTFATRRLGAVPGKTVTEKGVTSFQWHIPSADTSDLKLLEYRVSPDHRITYLKHGDICVNRLAYGPKSSLQLSPPSWPERPVIKANEFDVSAIMRLFGAACGLLVPKQ